MRHISDDELALPAGWAEEAAAAHQAVCGAPAAEKRQVIKDHSDSWRKTRATLAKLSDGKCWYCETKEPRSDRVIDHFRPKNSVAERNDHPGYWWLAFDVDNYRYSCTFCNSLRRSELEEPSGGKADHFPIWDEARRSFGPEDPVEDELPCLLDPKKKADTLLLTFGEDGRAVPTYSKEQHSVSFQRADTSIKLYHLNHPEIGEARLVLCNEVKELVREGDRAFARQEENPAAALVGTESFESVVRRIRAMIDKKAEYSRAARAKLRGYRTIPWVESILEDAH
jgi:hypothetical protein